MNRFRTGLLGAALVVVFLVALAPARVVAPLLPEGVVLGGLGGTVWNGHAARASLSMDGRVLVLGRVEWSVDPLSLLLLSPEVSLHSRWGSQRIDARIQRPVTGGLILRDVSAALDVGFTQHLLPLYVGGVLEIDLGRLQMTAVGLDRVEGRLVWRNAVWTAHAGDVFLGNYVLELVGQEAGAEGRVLTLSGPLSVAGSVAVQGRHYALDLDLSGPATDHDGLRQSLELLAAPREGGLDMVLKGEF